MSRGERWLSARRQQSIQRLALFGAIGGLLYLLHAVLGTRWAATGTVAGAWAVAVVGLDLLWGRAGQVSLGQGGFVAIGAYSTGILTVDHGWPPVAAMAAGVVVSLVIAYLLGLAVLGLAELYLALATLGFGLLVPALAAVMVDQTGGPSGLYGIPDFSLPGFHFTSLFEYYVLVWTVAGLAAWGALRLVNSRAGLGWTVLGHQPDVASSSGLPVKRRKIEVFVISAGLASVAGSLYAHFTHAITPETFGFPLAVLLLTYAIVGGVGTSFGPLLGAVIVNASVTYSGQTGKYTELLYGAVFLCVLYIAPSGVVGLSRRVWSLFLRGGDRVTRAVPASSGATALPLSQRSDRLRPEPEDAPMLQVVSASKSFGGLRALNGVSFEARPGTVTGLIGPNGAGKTTLLNLITGLYSADEGAVLLRGEDITRWPTDRRSRSGIARTFQTPSLVPGVSVLDNVAIGAYRTGRRGILASLMSDRGQRELESMRTRAREALATVGLTSFASYGPEELSFGQRRRLELARAIALQPELLLLDEPMSGLDQGEKVELCELISAIASRGAAVCLVEHDIEVVTSTCEWVTVLDFGEVIALERGSEVFHNPAVRTSYMGLTATPAPTESLR